MSWFGQLFSRRRRYDELSESIREHLDEKIEDMIDRGMTRKEAERKARREFGNVTLIEERSREVWQWPTLESLWADTKFASRQLVKNPGFTATAVISLALGIGATTAVFSVIYAALIHPYPYKAADRIVRLSIQSKTGDSGSLLLNGPQIRFLQQSPAVEDLIAMDDRSLPLTGGDYPEEVQATFITANGFRFLGVPPLLGRGILPSDATDGQEPQPVIVLSYKFWLRHFDANPDVVGQTIELNRKSYSIVGIASPRFRWQATDVYTPLKLTENPTQTYSFVLRLKPDVSQKAASAALQPLIQQFASEMPDRFPKNFQINTENLNDWVVRTMGRRLYLLFGGVVLLLAIGCGNVSILLLARGTVRENELAVRTALGAGRARLVQQLLTESFLLALIGAVIGVGVAYGAVAAMKVVLPEYIMFAPEFSMRINLPVLFFSVAVALATGILFGLSPALRSSRPQPGKILQSGARTIAGSLRGRRTHSVLISAQIALTLLLLVSAGGAIESFVRLLHVPLGYDPHNVISMFVPLHENTFTNWDSRRAYFEQLREKVSQVPGVTMAAFAPNATPPHAGLNLPFEVLGQPALDQRTALVNLVGPRFFSTLRLPLLQGRIWSETEDHNSAHLVVINQTMARLYFPNGDAIGHSIKLPGLENRPPHVLSAPGIADSWLQVIGVVGDSRDNGLRDPVAPAIFAPWTFYITPGTQILIRSKTPPLELLHSIRLALATVNPDQQAGRVVSDLDTWISNQPEWQQEHLIAWLFAAFAVLALSLAAVGLYSVVSYTVAQRTNEFGIRMALGAERGHILRLVFTSTAMSIGTGVLAGVVFALAMKTLLAAWLQGNLRDPILLPAGAVLLSLVAAIACYLPARRASQIDPMTALRSE